MCKQINKNNNSGLFFLYWKDAFENNVHFSAYKVTYTDILL